METETRETPYCDLFGGRERVRKQTLVVARLAYCNAVDKYLEELTGEIQRYRRHGSAYVATNIKGISEDLKDRAQRVFPDEFIEIGDRLKKGELKSDDIQALITEAEGGIDFLSILKPLDKTKITQLQKGMSPMLLAERAAILEATDQSE